MEKRTRILIIVLLIIKAAAALIFLTGFILTTASNYLLLSIFHGVWFIISFVLYMSGRPKTFKRANLAVILYAMMALMTFVFPGLSAFPIASTQTWQYPFQIKYAMTSGRPPQSFPEQIPDGASGYRFEFLPGFLQGDGHLVVSFTCDEEYISQVQSDIESRALKSFTVSEYPDYGIERDDDNWPIYLPLSARDEHPGGTLYFLDSNHYGNHARGTAVLIDGDFIMYINM